MQRNSVVVYVNSQSSKSYNGKGCDSLNLIKQEEDRLKRRREWLREQKMLKEHEKYKQKKIKEYEAKRAYELKLKHSKQRSSNLSYSRERHRSKSLEMSDKIKFRSNSSKIPAMLQELQSPNGRVPVFKGPEGTQISIVELRQIQVDIHRNITSTVTTDEVQRNIINPEEIMLARRDGEGSTPLFKREELKSKKKHTDLVEEHQTIISIDSTKEVRNANSSRKRSMSESPLRNHSHSSRQQLSSHHTREADVE